MTVLAVGSQDGIAGALTDITSFVIRLAGALLVLLVGVLIAKALARTTRRVLDRTGFNRAVDRGGIRRFLAHSRYEPAQVLGKLVFWVVVLCALQLALAVFGPNPVGALVAGVVAYLPRVFLAIVVVVAAVALGRFVRDVLRGMLRLTPFGHQLAAAAGIAIVVAGCFVALDQLQVAPAIVTGLWYALLIGVVGSVVVAFGVGGIPVARRYLERAADDLDGRLTKLNAVKAAERAAARANRAVEPHATAGGTDRGNGQTALGVSGVAQPGTGYPVDPGSAYPSDRPAGTYGGDAIRLDGGYDPSAYPGSSTPRDVPLQGQGYDRTDRSSRSGGYTPERSGGARPPGEPRRPTAQPPGGQGPSPAGTDQPRGAPRPFDDGRTRGYGRSGSRPEDYGDTPDANGYGDNYPYPR